MSSSVGSINSGSLIYLQSLSQAGLLSLGKTLGAGTANPSPSTSTSIATPSSTQLQVSAQALALQDNTELIGSATGTLGGLNQNLQQLNALSIAASNASGKGNAQTQTLNNAAALALGQSAIPSQLIEASSLSNASSLVSSVSSGIGSNAFTLATLGTELLNASSASASAPPGSTTSSKGLTASGQALALYQSIQQHSATGLLPGSNAG
jgi:hypothetical protein